MKNVNANLKSANQKRLTWNFGKISFCWISILASVSFIISHLMWLRQLNRVFFFGNVFSLPTRYEWKNWQRQFSSSTLSVTRSAKVLYLQLNSLRYLSMRPTIILLFFKVSGCLPPVEAMDSISSSSGASKNAIMTFLKNEKKLDTYIKLHFYRQNILPEQIDE